MLTPFGKFCRKLRIDNGELLKDMAIKLDVTSSYLSAVENGKRNVPDKWIEQLTEIYTLDKDQATKLNQAFQESQKGIKIDFDEYNKEDKSILMALAQELKGLEPSEKMKIKDILSKKRKFPKNEISEDFKSYNEKTFKQDAK